MAAIGEPRMVDTSKDARLGRIFMNRTVRFYPAFAEFYGMEETIERIVAFFRHAAQGLEERKQILYLLGPVGGDAVAGCHQQAVGGEDKLVLDLLGRELHQVLVDDVADMLEICIEGKDLDIATAFLFGQFAG